MTQPAKCRECGKEFDPFWLAKLVGTQHEGMHPDDCENVPEEYCEPCLRIIEAESAWEQRNQNK